MAGLSVNDIVSVGVSLTPLAVPLRNFGALLVIGPTADIIDTTERLRLYTTLDAVTADFGTSAPEYKAAALFFSQQPQPALLYVGRWAQSNTKASIHGGVPLAADQVVSGWTSITTGSMSITVDGVVKNLSGLNFGAQTNMNGVATVIQTALGGGITCIWNAAYKRFEIRSSTAGTSSTITYATPTGSGVDISAKSGLSLVGGASPPVNGINAETPLAAITALTAYGSWYGSLFAPTASTDITDAQHIAVAGYIEGVNPVRVYGISTQAAAVPDPVQTGDIASSLKALGYNRTFVQYSSSSAYVAASAYGRMFTVNFDLSMSMLTIKFKQEPGVVGETLSETQAAALKSKNCNVYIYYNTPDGTPILQEGVMSSGIFMDERHGLDWLQNRVQTDIFNLLYTTTTKIPQTDSGIATIRATVENSLAAGVFNGLIAPGQWNGPGFGQINTGSYLPKGYYTYQMPINQQSQSDREQRKAPPIRCAVKLAGAVHFVNVQLDVNR